MPVLLFPLNKNVLAFSHNVMMSDKFGSELATEIGQKIHHIHSEFPVGAFVEDVVSSEVTGGWAAQIAEALYRHLPQDYPEALKILMKVLGPEQPLDTPMPDAYKLAPIASFVVRYGLDHFQASMQALYEIGKRSYVAQVAIRPFIVQYPQDTLELFYEWTRDENTHIRCLVSGGTRPRLRLRAMPGVNKLLCFIEDPVPLLALLGRLKDDVSYRVRRSVSGNLSDIIKDNPDTAYATMNQWQKGAGKQALQVIRNALKHSVKKGDRRVIELFDRCKDK